MKTSSRTATDEVQLHRCPGQGEADRQPVQPGAPAQRRDHAQPDPRATSQRIAAGMTMLSVTGRTRAMVVGHRLVVDVRVAQARRVAAPALRAAQIAADEDALHVAGRYWLDLRVAQAEFLADPLQALRVAVLRAHPGDRVAGQREEHQEASARSPRRASAAPSSEPPDQEPPHAGPYLDDRGRARRAARRRRG